MKRAVRYGRSRSRHGAPLALVGVTALITGLLSAGAATAAQSAPIQSAPIQSAPIQSAPIQSAPIQSAPIPLQQVSTGAIFNDPTGTPAEQYAIRDHLRHLVDASPAGSTIRMSIYNITDHDRAFADALVAAADRGVRVHVVLDSVNTTGSSEAIVAGLGTDRSAPSWAAVCDAGCHGTRHNHNKFSLFSDIGGEPVVVQSSANLTIMNAEGFWNNAVTFAGDGDLHAAYVSYFDDLARNVEDPDYYRVAHGDNVKVYHFPRASGDTVYNALGNVGCTTEQGERTVIRVGMWYFGRDAVANRLADLARAGCRVDVVTTEMLDGPRQALEGVQGVRLRQLPEGGDTIIHSKYFTIDGHYADADRMVVFTGSPNFSGAALTLNDETMVRIYSGPIHDQYVANFQRIFDLAS